MLNKTLLERCERLRSQIDAAPDDVYVDPTSFFSNLDDFLVYAYRDYKDTSPRLAIIIAGTFGYPETTIDKEFYAFLDRRTKKPEKQNETKETK